MLQELDTAIYNRLQGITLLDEDDVAQTVPIIIKAPETEFKDVELPAVSVALIDIRYAPERQDWIHQEEIDIVGGVAYKKDMPIPYDILFQISTYTEYLEDDRSIQAQLLKKLPPRTYLEVDVLGATPLSQSYYMFLQGYGEGDIIGDKRIYRKIFTYLVPVELDFDMMQEVKLVQEALITGEQL